eukprot:gene31094-6223_t
MPPGKMSKRRLKNKMVQSLRGKKDASCATAGIGLDLLSEELREQMGDNPGLWNPR